MFHVLIKPIAMPRLFFFLLSLFLSVGLSAQDSSTQYYLDRELTKTCSPEHAHFSLTLIENEDSSITNIIRDEKKDEILVSETYKNGEAIGIWIMPHGTGFRELDYRFKVLYSNGNCTPEKELVNLKDYFVDHAELAYEAPRHNGTHFSLHEYLNKHLIYPDEAKENAIQGEVMLSLYISHHGKLESIEVTKGVHISLDKEAVRVFRDLHFTPAKFAGKDVPLCIKLPIKFNLHHIKN